jgi:general secretion pathway protein G
MKAFQERNRTGRRGFTLLELIVVITIIGILGTVVLVNVVGRTGQAREVKVRTDLRQIYEAAQQYYLDTGYWPDTLDQLINPTHPVTGDRIPGGFTKMPKDPWGVEYEYELVDGEPVIRCYGRDQGAGGEGEDKDYEYPEPEEYE